MVDKKTRIALNLENINSDSRISKNSTDYFECPLCLIVPYSSKIMECNCGHRGCESCIKDWTKGALLQKDHGICWGSCDDKKNVKKLTPPNKIMMELLRTVMVFDCKACERYWSLDELNNHRLESRCVKDPSADNLISKLADRPPKVPKN